MPLLLLLMLGGGGYYLYQKKQNPNWTPFGKPKALAAVKAASATTPSPTLGLDPGMTADQVTSVNAALSSATDPTPVYALASSLSSAFPNSAKALVTKADALSAANAAGATDAELLQNMLAAGTYSFPEASS